MPFYTVDTAPVIYPIQVDAVLKQHMRLPSGSDEDDLLTEYLKAATEWVERYIGYPLMTQVVIVDVGDDPEERQLLTGNVLSVVSYSYTDTDDATQTVTDATATGLEIEKDGHACFVINEDWPSGTNFKIKVNCGYTVDNIPADIRQAVRLMMSKMYEVREPIPETAPDTVIEILDRHVLY